MNNNKNNKTIYFDNAASAKPKTEAIEAFNAVVTENFSNPAALHKGGIEAEKTLATSRKRIISCLPSGGSLLFTSGATESNNLAIMNTVKSRRKTKVVTTAIEHPSVSNVIAQLSEKEGYGVVRVPPGENMADDIINAVDENTALVSIIAVCGETGFIVADTAQIYSEVKSRFHDCIVHIDGVQGFLKTGMNADLISISSHKIGGIAGVGGLYIKEKIKVNPMLFGGGQQKGIRPWTEPTALIAAFGAAVSAVPESAAETTNTAFALNQRLIEGLNRLNLQINSRIGCSVPDIVNFSCGVKSEIMLHFLAEHGVYVSSGSACARGKKSRILPAYGVSDRDIDTAIRVSFGGQNKVEEVDEFLNILEEGIKRWK